MMLRKGVYLELCGRPPDSRAVTPNWSERGSNVDVKSAIETGDANALRRVLEEDSTLANTLIVWGKKCDIHTHPLHYISDMLFEGTLQRGKEMAVLEALLAAGADCNHQAANG